MMQLDRIFPEFETHVSNMSDGDVRLSVKSAERMCGCVDGRVEAQEEPASEIVHCRDCRHWRIAGDVSCPMSYEQYYDDEDDGGYFEQLDNTPDDGSGFCHMGERWGS